MIGRTAILAALALAWAWPSPLAGQANAPGERERSAILSAALSRVLDPGSRRMGETGAAIDTTRFVKRYTEWRVETAPATWSEAERSAMLEAAAAADVRVRPCGADCRGLGSNNLITLGTPRFQREGRASVLVELRDTGGRIVQDLHLERRDRGWEVIDRDFVVATDWIPCDEACRQRQSADSTRTRSYPQ